MDFRNFNEKTSKHTVFTRNGQEVSPDDPYVQKKLEEMKRKFGRYMGNDFFDNMLAGAEGEGNHQINAQEPNGQVQRNEFQSAEDFHEEGPGAVECKNCGARSAITQGGITVCEYCGSILK
jgi:hypothetical protein